MSSVHVPASGAVYTGRATNWPMVVATAVAAVALVGFGRPPGGSWTDLAWPFALAAVGVTIELLTATSVRTSTGPNGVRVYWGVFGWPRLSYPIARIVRAEVIDLSALWVSWGFWWTPRRTCCTVRSGPTLRLTLDTGRTVTVTVPDPAAAVASIEGARRSIDR